MSNSIPPLVCSTPPPIDCIADNTAPIGDDFGDFIAIGEQYEDSSVSTTPVYIPQLLNADIGIHNTLSTSPPPHNIDDRCSPVGKVDDLSNNELEPPFRPTFYPQSASRTEISSDLTYILQTHSPPPLDFVTEENDLRPCDDINEDEDIDDIPDDTVSKYDDNISLPSLKFDSPNNISKSTTPVSEDLVKSTHVDLEDINNFEPIRRDESTGEITLITNSDYPCEFLSNEKLSGIEVPFDCSTKEKLSDTEIEIKPFENESAVLESTENPSEFVTATSQHVFAEECFPKAATNELVFEADFSQFSNFETSQPSSQSTEPKIIEGKSSLDDLEADDFDDFQDFASVSVEKSALQESVAETTERIEESTQPPDNFSNDDDFGDFNAVTETYPEINTPLSKSNFSLSNLNDKLKPILEMMFPVVQDDESQSDSEHWPANQSVQLSASAKINHVDAAKALEYQWNNSDVRHSLIKSIGLDSRNILYGENWNSCMPRYAANLSFNPLEPIKSEKPSASGVSADYKRSSLATKSSTLDVPAAEFDWNSSGLVNPLDGSKEIRQEGAFKTVHTSQSRESDTSTDQQQSLSTSSANSSSHSNDKSLRRVNNEETNSNSNESKSDADASVAIPSTAATEAATTASAAITTAPVSLPGNYIDIIDNFDVSMLENRNDLDAAKSLVSNRIPNATVHEDTCKTDLEKELQHSGGVVTTSTYSGPLKETHIFTPSKGDGNTMKASSKTPRTSESKCPIDFDYEIAASGIIIDETVVKKEYRDIEYNPRFGLKRREHSEDNSHAEETVENQDTIGFSSDSTSFDAIKDYICAPTIDNKEEKLSETPSLANASCLEDEFTDFQSVPAPRTTSVSTTASIFPPNTSTGSVSPSHSKKLKDAELSVPGSRNSTPLPLSDEMILSPAILIPQAIKIENEPKIEWPGPGINPEELARIEELFPQPKGSISKSSSTSPKVQAQNSQQQQKIMKTNSSNTIIDDDDWCEFVSVPIATTSIPTISQQFQKQQVSPMKSSMDSNDEEWSDFVSSTPVSSVSHLRKSPHPQFNSAAWQNANFYNNPMSVYASPPTNFYYQPPQQQQQQQHQNLTNNFVPNTSTINNNNYSVSNSINQYLINNQTNHIQHQHIQMMRDFSTASPMDGGSLSSKLVTPTLHYHQYTTPTTNSLSFGNDNSRKGFGNASYHGRTSQFGNTSSKVAPSISLIPDLGFVAPSHTSFISVPKQGFMSKK